MTRIRIALFLTLATFISTDRAFAQTYIWSFQGGGGWQETSKWTGGVPQGVTAGDILIHPDFGGTINGPLSNTIAHNLTLGADIGTTILNHYANIDYLAFTGQVTIETGGKLRLQPDKVFGAQLGITNAGEIELIGGVINAGPITNTGTIRGYGQISAPVLTSGQIELFDQTNDLTFYQSVTNQPAGLIAVRETNVRIRGGLTNQGALSISDGSVDFFADISNSGTVGLSSGSTVSLVGDLVQNGTANLLAGSRLIVFGKLSGTGGTTGSGTLEVLGAMSPGSSAARVNFGGSVLLGGTASTLIELGGVNSGEYDSLHVANSISLSGSLDVSLLNGFTPQLGDRFEIVAAGNAIQGQFSADAVPSLGPNVKFETFYSPTSAVLAVVPAIAGDYNANGVVDAADYVVWRNTKDQVGLGLVADGNHDNVIDSGDYNLWRSNFGQMAGSGAMSSAAQSLSATVPEPSTWTLLILVGLRFAVRSKRVVS